MKAQTNFKILSQRQDSDTFRDTNQPELNIRKQKYEEGRDSQRDRITFNNYMRQDNSLSASLGGERTGSTTLARDRQANIFGKSKDQRSPVNMNFAERVNQQDPHLTYNRQSRPITSQDYNSKGKQRLSGDAQGDRNPYNQTQNHNFNNLRGSQGSSDANRTLQDNIEELKQKKLRSIEQTPQESIYDINFKSRLITPTNATQDRSQATSHFNFQNQNDDGENQDLEQQLMGLQGKIQNLEGKYIDLANFYKQGALRGKIQNSSTAQGSRSSTAENFYPNRGSSPLREFDQIQEKSIINELIKEKSDLEKELQNIISLQGTLIQQDQRISDKIDNLNKNYNSTAQYFSNQLSNPHAMQHAELLVEKYEKELIQYINQNYNSFTEKDITSIFNQLKTELQQVYVQKDQQRDHIQQSSAFNNDELIKILNEFEINQQYSQQDLKKVIFDAQSKHDLMLLDLKKSNMILQSLSKSINDFDSISLRQRSTQYSNTSPNRKPMSSDEQIHEIQVQIKSLQQTFSQLQSKVTSSGDDFRLLMATPEEFSQNFTQLKKQIESIAPYDQQQLPINNDKAFEIMKEELIDLRTSNQQLTSDLKFATERSTLVLEENQQLRQHIENLDKRREASPLNMIRRGMDEFTRENNSRQSVEKYISNPDRSKQRDKEFQQLQRELRLVSEQNQSLDRQVQQLSRSLSEKESEIERLGRDLSKVSQLNTLQTISHHRFENEPSSNVSIDQLNFYKSFADQQIIKLKNLIRQTQKFLYAMKKLQKAVHKKQPNVQTEKGDFEVTRKELEYMLKDLKKEVDENINAHADKRTKSSRLDVQGFRDSQNQRDQAHFNIRESLDQQNYRSLSNM